MPHPDGLPELFLDRSLGRIKVPRLLREAGLNLVTLAEHYGVPTFAMPDAFEPLIKTASPGSNQLFTCSAASAGPVT